MLFVCPRCKGPLGSEAGGYHCAACGSAYPVICGIADFRLQPDAYISIERDREKGADLFRAAERRTFEEMLHYYYSITPEVSPALAARWIAHALAGTSIAEMALCDAGLGGASGALLDIGCSTGGLLVAAAGRFGQVVGLDVAFRWLVIGQVRLRECGVAATLVCANAEHLPFADCSFGTVTAVDVLEHVRDAGAAVREAWRVSAEPAKTLCLTNNRYAPLPDPHVRLWGVGWLPRRWQASYVAAFGGNAHRYQVAMRSARELDRLFRAAGFRCVATQPAPLQAPHRNSRALRRMLSLYNAVRLFPAVKQLLKMAGPRLKTMAER